jgi:Cu+-exporting ATPase
MNLSTTHKKKAAVDPVCGMAVEPGSNKIITTINGETYYFCAEGCRQSFEKNPKKFLKPKAKKKGIWGRYLERLEKANGGRAMKCH